LSFLLWHDDTPLIVDTATSTYAPGPDRELERSTRAHNTVVVDGQDSTEVWGAFRAGRRARVTIGEAAYLPAAGTATAHARLIASHDGYRWLPGAPSHRHPPSPAVETGTQEHQLRRGSAGALTDRVVDGDGARHHRVGRRAVRVAAHPHAVRQPHRHRHPHRALPDLPDLPDLPADPAPERTHPGVSRSGMRPDEPSGRPSLPGGGQEAVQPGSGRGARDSSHHAT
jgi:hypothetical protein